MWGGTISLQVLAGVAIWLVGTVILFALIYAYGERMIEASQSVGE